MIILLVVSAIESPAIIKITGITVFSWSRFLQDANLIAQIIGVIAIVLYVIYTYKTFQQIKKQTDYQQDAYLKVESTILKDLTEIRNPGDIHDFRGGRIYRTRYPLISKYLIKDIPERMMNILSPIFPEFDKNLFDGNYYTVILTNYGNAEVNSIKLDLKVIINISKNVAEPKRLKEQEIYSFPIEINEIIGRNGGKLTLPIIATAAFPIYLMELKGTYSDIRNKAYNIEKLCYEGQNEHFHKLPQVQH